MVLQEEGQVKKRITPAQIKKMLQIQAEQGADSVLELLSAHFPTLITSEGRESQDEADRSFREMRRVGEYAPRITVPAVGQRPADEPAATVRQLAYLRDLGVQDEAMLSRIGMYQASELIDEVIELRRSIPREDPPAKAGCLPLFLAGAVFVFLLGYTLR